MTVAHMSPEQLRGEPLDARTDLFSFGLVLYEMATGRPAFAGSTSAVVSAAILHETPLAPRHVRPDLPSALEQVLLKALEKDRDVRCQTASELRADLKRVKRDLDSHSRPNVAESSTIVSTPALEVPRTPPAPASSDVQLVAALVQRHRGCDGSAGRDLGARGSSLRRDAMAVAAAFARISIVNRQSGDHAADIDRQR